MSETRINPDTGVLEEKRWHGWSPKESTEGRHERVNLDTGVQEEKRWHGWSPSEKTTKRLGMPVVSTPERVQPLYPSEDSSPTVSESDSSGGAMLLALVFGVLAVIAIGAGSNTNTTIQEPRRHSPAEVPQPRERKIVYASYSPNTDWDRIHAGLAGSMLISGHVDGSCPACSARLRIYRKDVDAILKCPSCKGDLKLDEKIRMYGR